MCTGAGDFTEVLGFHVNFDEDSYSTTVMVTVNEDGILENDEVFFGRLRLIGVERIELTEDVASITIIDNDGEYTKPANFFVLQSYPPFSTTFSL